MKKLRFDELMLSKEIQKAVADMGFEEATPIQSEAIPVLLEGHDVIGQAQTGTGKTAAFGIPAIELLDASDKSPQVIILCPTRELAIQVAEEMNKLAKYKRDVHFLPVYGGQPIDRQLKALKKGAHIIIGTPGRIMDHMERGTIDLKKIKMVVLDEADEMLDMGFRDDIELILKTTPKQRQTVMFSATMPSAILEMTKKYQKTPQNIKVVHEVLTVAGTEQIYFEVKEKNKLEALTRIVDMYNLKLVLVFSNTKKGVDDLVEHLQARGYSVDGLHGDMKQAAREKVMGRFRKGVIEILVATDVAARGLDVENVEAVFNFDMPQDEEYYVHRIGRTGRAGKKGKAFTFVTGREMFKLRDIQKYIKTKIKLNPIPSFDDVEEVKINTFLESVKKTIEDGKLNRYAHFVEKLIDEDCTSLDVAAALIKMNLDNEKLSSDNNDISGFDSSGERERSRGKDREGSRGRDRSSRGDVSDLKQVRLFLNVGKKDNVRPGDILGAIAGETGLPGKIIGEIDMYDKFTFVNIPEKYADEIIRVMQDNQIRGKKISIEVAKDK
ncbi:MAG: DEAD/DEAH box helicase [Ignavibacteria bacterium]